MTNTKTMEEVRAEYILLMGEELGAVFSTLDKKLVELHIVWQQYQQLFGADPDTVKLLNRTSGLFFKVVQDELWNSVLLGISRMTDPPSSGGKKNLTIQSLPSLVSDLGLRAELESLCSTALVKTEFAREHRNKRIAHQDHGYMSNRASNPLSGISRNLVVAMLASLCDVLNRLNRHYKDSTKFYDFIDETGARVLVTKLNQLERLKATSSAL